MAFASRFRRVFAGSNSLSYLPPSCFHYCSTLTSPKLFVSGLSRLTTNEKLQDAVASFGQLVDGKFLGGWVIFVDLARPREPIRPMQQEPPVFLWIRFHNQQNHRVV